MPFTLAAAGDIIMLSAVSGKDAAIYASVAKADLATANLEMVVTDSEAATDKFINLRLPPRYMDDVTSLGFKAMCVANNHSLDYGVGGLYDTLEFTRQAGIIPVGAGKNVAESVRAEVIESNGRKVAMLGASATLPNSSAAGEHSPGIAPIRVINRYRIDTVTIDESPGMSPFVETEAVAPDVERLCAAVRACAGEVDHVVVHLHWGVPLGWVVQTQDEIADYQRPLAHALIDAGANLIIGHHPHYVQGVEFYKDTPILYSLGNFLKHKLSVTGDKQHIHPPYKMSSLRGYWNKVGALAQIEWNAPGQRPVCKFEILQLDDNGEPHRATRETGQAMLDNMKEQCAGWGTSATLEEGPDGQVCISFN